MTYKEFRDRVLQLINQKTLAGEEIAMSYNAQADYVLRIPGLLDSAQRLLATTTRKIDASIPLDWDSAEERNGWYIIPMPADFFQLNGREIPVLRNGHYFGYHSYKWFGRNKIAVPAHDKADMVLNYYRYPTPVPEDPPDSYELDNSEDAQDAASYYVAAQLIMYDNPFAYQALYNQFEDRRVEMVDRPQTEYADIQDVFYAGDVEG